MPHLNQQIAGAASDLIGPEPSAALAAPTPIASPIVIRLIQLPGGAAGVHAQVGGHDGLYLFDTGGGMTLVSPITASQSGCQVWGQVTGFRATGERLDLPRCDDVHMQVSGFSVVVPIASVLDMRRLMPLGYPALAGSLALDAFAGKVITIRPTAHELVVETPASLPARTAGAILVPIRLVRDAQGVALSVDGAVRTPVGLAWMEIDIGNLGPLLIGRHVAPVLGLDARNTGTQQVRFTLGSAAGARVPVVGDAHVGSYIMDGDIGQSVLKNWDITLDLEGGRAWFRKAPSARPGERRVMDTIVVQRNVRSPLPPAPERTS